MKITISTLPSKHPCAPSPDLIRSYLVGALARRGIHFETENIQFVEGNDKTTGLFLDSGDCSDSAKQAVAYCLNQWNALLCRDFEFIEKIRNWSLEDEKLCNQDTEAVKGLDISEDGK
jgi:hypothetical protein